MQKPSVKCALLATMIAKHRWGTPITKENLLSLSAIDGDYPTAREVYDDLRREAYITHRGNRGIELDKSNFAELADVLYHECQWEAWEIESRLKHYEGLADHDWS
ncbi:hypothetical protein [Halopenitus persicus]|jgi:hypothetical protein|uniref:Uncharacterized protein n=1 Tax=Halopenitus persicus TaxID=1048396 RepID=A0A1H3IXK1_9EURY|nr:hypothetical protein [Halopenitus persicus]QHS17307.1 hypothetical protein GWK26_09205 [haloarchaeon 3A1-DGR]SDY32456.1 hypothetical protein SAMN05216564_104302 [Halopenitus persicus]